MLKSTVIICGVFTVIGIEWGLSRHRRRKSRRNLVDYRVCLDKLDAVCKSHADISKSIEGINKVVDDITKKDKLS